MTDCDWQSRHVNSDPRVELGEKVKAERVRQRYDVKAAAKAAGIARDTWAKIEAGESVQDTKRAAATQLLGLTQSGDPMVRQDVTIRPPAASVGGPSEDGRYVASPGARVDSGVTDDEVLREIRAMRADVEGLRAEVRADFGSVFERLEKLEQPRP